MDTPWVTALPLVLRAEGTGRSYGSVWKASWKKGPRSRASTVTPSLMWMSIPVSPFLTCPGENVAADGSLDLSKLEVSLTLANKFEGLETDADDTSARSLLLR